MSAGNILSLLADKHIKDVFVPECKGGPTWGSSHCRLDAWAMKRSWANPQITGYEIKVSRSDWLKDEKWTSYLGLCNCLYFVCTPRVIEVQEVPDEAGLLYTSATGSRLYTKKRAPYRPVQVPESLYQYILMSRAEIVGEHREKKKDTGYWRAWLAQKEEGQRIGYGVSRRIAAIVSRLQSEKIDAERRADDYQEIKDMLATLGLDPKHASTWTVRDRVRKYVEGHDPALPRLLGEIHGSVGRLIAKLEDK